MRKVCDFSGLLQRVSFLTGEVKAADFQTQHSGHTMLRGQRSEFLAAEKVGKCIREKFAERGPHKFISEGWVYILGKTSIIFLIEFPTKVEVKEILVVEHHWEQGSAGVCWSSFLNGDFQKYHS